MKLERISENKIRCTLNKADLADKQLLLNELAYGTDKAKELFSEMMQKASAELGFEAENIPLMVEAIPVSKDCLILIITKVEDPEELDTRFSNFTRPPIDISDEDYDDDLEAFIDDTTAMLDNIRNLVGDAAANIEKELSPFSGNEAASVPEMMKTTKEQLAKAKQQKAQAENAFRIYRFTSLAGVSTASELVETLYNGENSLYKNPSDNQFYLVIHTTTNKDVFNRVCNILGEYGDRIKASYAMPYYIQEHYKLIVKQNALQTLAKL